MEVIDLQLLAVCNRWAENPYAGALALFLSSPALVVLVTLPLAVMLVRQKRFATMVMIAGAMAAADALTARVLKPAVGRPRPCHTDRTLLLPGPCGTGRSMPSGHATVAFALVAAAGSVLDRRATVLLAVVATAVALSRVVLGVHYPSDVVVGGLVGGAVGFGAGGLLRRSRRRRRSCP